MGSSKRNTFSTAKDIPGPGSYSIPEKIVEGPQYVMGIKGPSSLSTQREVPGPGQYAPKTFSFSTIAFS